MNRQTSFTDYKYDNRSRRTRREQFLASMDEMIPWQDWLDMIEPYYPKGTHGRKPIGAETMLRMYLMRTLQCRHIRHEYENFLLILLFGRRDFKTVFRIQGHGSPHPG